MGFAITAYSCVQFYFNFSYSVLVSVITKKGNNFYWHDIQFASAGDLTFPDGFYS